MKSEVYFKYLFSSKNTNSYDISDGATIIE